MELMNLIQQLATTADESERLNLVQSNLSEIQKLDGVDVVMLQANLTDKENKISELTEKHSELIKNYWDAFGKQNGETKQTKDDDTEPKPTVINLMPRVAR